MATLAAGLFLAAATAIPRRHRRWRFAAVVGGLLAATYLFADFSEDVLLVRLLHTADRWDPWLPRLAALKFGAFVGAAPIFLVSFAGALGRFWQAWDSNAWRAHVDLERVARDWTAHPTSMVGRVASFALRAKTVLGPSDPAGGGVVGLEQENGGSDADEPGPWRRLGQRVRRWTYRLAGAEPSSEHPAAPDEAAPAPPKLAISCSGGGIRSAAFNLGALQALDTPSEGGPSVVDQADLLSGVSGGSYIAGAWVTARENEQLKEALEREALKKGKGSPERPWERGSPEEQHLRRNASYIAPGPMGKLWLLTRFTLGFGLNLLLISLAVGALFLPLGWAIDRAEVVRPVTDGELSLPKGGCLLLPTGAAASVLPDATLHIAKNQMLRGDHVISRAKKDGDTPTAEVSLAAGKATAKANVSGSGAVSARTASGDQEVRGDASIGPTTTSTTSTGPTTAPPTTAPPAGPPGCAAALPVPPTTTTAAPTTTTPAPPPAATSTTSTTAPPPPLEKVAPRGALHKGDKVGIVTRPIRVTGADLRACEERLDRNAPTTTSTVGPCAAEAAGITNAGPGTLLVSFDEGVFTLGRDGVVANNGVIARACGNSPCERFDPPSQLGLSVALFAGLAVIAGMSMIVARSTAAASKVADWITRRLVVGAALAAVVSFVVPQLVIWGEGERRWIEDKALALGAVGAVGVVLAVVAQIAPYMAGAAALEEKAGKSLTVLKNVGKRLRPLFVRFAAVVVGPLIIVIIAIAFASYGAQRQWSAVQFAVWVALLGPLLILGSGADLNEWSMHPFYRDRLQSAFAVDPRHWPIDDPREDPLGKFPGVHPQLLICASANLADARVTAPGRPVTLWTFEAGTEGPEGPPARMGSRTLGRAIAGKSDVEGAASAEEADEWVGMFQPSNLPPHLRHLAWTWTAVAVSGAAISPAMGKMTVPERFLLALANIRLGLWYPNPTLLRSEPGWYERHQPRPWYLIKEAIGRHRVNDRWIYLTDGGHYENLGVIELLRRRCGAIYCFDASGDTPDTFGTLADAMRLAREEMDIEIDIDPKLMKPDKDGLSKVAVRAGTIRYPGEKDANSWLVIAKLAVPEKAPFDVIDLARTIPSFPNNPTADQLYTDQKFEAYRALGHYLGEQARALEKAIHEAVGGGKGVKDAVDDANKAQAPKADPPAKCNCEPCPAADEKPAGGASDPA